MKRHILILIIVIISIIIFTNHTYSREDHMLLNCTAGATDVDNNLEDINILWYKSGEEGLEFNSSSKNITVPFSELRNNIFVCIASANDSKRMKSIPAQKYYTHDNDSAYVPYGSIISEVSKINSYEGNDYIPLRVKVYGNTSIDFNSKAYCKGGVCDEADAEISYDKSKVLDKSGKKTNNIDFLKRDSIYAEYPANLNIIAKNPFITTIASSFTSENAIINSSSTNSYEIQYIDETKSIYDQGYIDNFIKINYKNGNSETLTSNSVIIGNEVKNITLLPRLVLYDRHHISGSISLDAIPFSQISSDDADMLKKIDNNVFDPKFDKEGNVNVTINLQENLVTPDNLKPVVAKVNSEKITFNILKNRCPLDIDMQPMLININQLNDFKEKIHLDLIYGDGSKTEPGIDNMELELDSEYPQVNQMFDINKNDKELYLETNEDFDFDNFQNEMNIENTKEKYLINVTYDDNSCDILNSRKKVNFTDNIEGYNIKVKSYTIYFKTNDRDFRTIIIKNVSSGSCVDPYKINLKLHKGNKEGIKFYESYSKSCEQSHTNKEIPDGIGASSFRVIKKGTYILNVSIGEEYIGQVEINTECPFVDTIEIKDEELNSRNNLKNSIFTLDNISLIYKNKLPYDILGQKLELSEKDLKEYLGLKSSGQLAFDNNSVEVLSCNQGNNQETSINVSFNPSKYGFCENIESKENFKFASSQKRRYKSTLDDDTKEMYLNNHIVSRIKEHNDGEVPTKTINDLKMHFNNKEFLKEYFEEKNAREIDLGFKSKNYRHFDDDSEIKINDYYNQDYEYLNKIIKSIMKDIVIDEDGDFAIPSVPIDENDQSCCNKTTHCVYEGKCYKSGTVKDIDGDGILEKCNVVS
ncbi:MAG: hypothetical protein ACQER9_03450 [Nanobdellota archaeon]